MFSRELSETTGDDRCGLSPRKANAPRGWVEVGAERILRQDRRAIATVVGLVGRVMLQACRAWNPFCS